MNPVGVGRARLDRPVAEGRACGPTSPIFENRQAGPIPVSALDTEPESGGPAFGPCQKHLATADGDCDQIDRRLEKD